MYKYFNNNPKGKHTTDCIIRSLSFGLCKPYQTILQELIEVFIETGYHIADPTCLAIYMNRNHYKRYDINNLKITAGQLCELILNKDFTNIPGITDINNVNILACIGSTHVTYIKNGVIYDIINCSSGKITSYYVV